MARVVFLQRDAIELLGVMYLSAVLKSHGHSSDIYVESLEDEDTVVAALGRSPDIVAFSCLTNDYFWALEKAAAIKQAGKALIVFGGTHVTLNAEEAILEPAIDVVCRGEGEYAMLDLADAVDQGHEIGDIGSLFVKQGGEVRKNEIRPLVEDLDSLPFPDRHLYSKYRFLRSRGNRPLHLGRGCPYRCSYCHNTRKAALTAGKGRLVRWRSMDGVLAEIEQIREQGRVSLLHFIDDGFGLNQSWLKEFLVRLVKLPGKRLALHANMRADAVTDDLCATFREYGAHLLRLRIAVECGEEAYRREVLGKTLSNEQLIRAARSFRRHGIPFATYNMVGLPGERLEQAMETLRLNLELKPSQAFCFMYQPYPGTDLADYAVKHGFLNAEMLQQIGTPGYRGLFDSRSPLRQGDIRKIENLQRVFGLTVRFPALFPLTRRVSTVEAVSPVLRALYSVFVRALRLHRRLVDKY